MSKLARASSLFTTEASRSKRWGKRPPRDFAVLSSPQNTHHTSGRFFSLFLRSGNRSIIVKCKAVLRTCLYSLLYRAPFSPARERENVTVTVAIIVPSSPYWRARRCARKSTNCKIIYPSIPSASLIQPQTPSKVHHLISSHLSSYPHLGSSHCVPKCSSLFLSLALHFSALQPILIMYTLPPKTVTSVSYGR